MAEHTLSLPGALTGRNRRLYNRFSQLLDSAGIAVDGTRAWDIKVKNERLFARVFAEGSLGLGDAYVEGWWECEALDEFFTRLLRARLNEKVHGWHDLWLHVIARVVNLQRPDRAFEIGQAHYDLGNDLFERMLGHPMVYSCGYWKDAGTVQEAQRAKLDLVCRKLDLKPGMRVLDIGCGWGEALRYAAENYGVEAVGVTVSREQVNHARALCEGLPVDVRLQDYRDVHEKFDRVFSIGMFEHVGKKNFRTYMQTVRALLKPGGWTLLHTIGLEHSSGRPDAWIAKHIFPNSILPDQRDIAEAADKLFIIEDWHNFGPDYDRTLMAWHERFEAAWPDLKDTYGERFRRMWRYYLLSCAGGFRSRRVQLWQVLLSPEGLPGGHEVPR